MQSAHGKLCKLGQACAKTSPNFAILQKFAGLCAAILQISRGIPPLFPVTGLLKRQALV
jgi:hypothetical protein